MSITTDNPNQPDPQQDQSNSSAQPTSDKQQPSATAPTDSVVSNPTTQAPTQTPTVSPVHHSVWRSLGDVLSGIPRSRVYIDHGTGRTVNVGESQNYRDSATGETIQGPKPAKASDILLAIAGHALMGSFAGAGEKGPGAPMRAFGKAGQATVEQNEQQDQTARTQANQDYTRSLTAFETNLRNMNTSMALARTDKEMHDSVAEGNKSILDNIDDQFKYNNGEEVSEHDAQDLKKFPPHEWIRYATRTIPSLDDQGNPIYVDMHGHLSSQDAPGAHQKFESVYQLVHKNASGDIKDENGNVASWLQKAVTAYDGLIPGASKSLLQGNGATGQISASTASKIHDSYVSLNLLQHDLDQFANTVNSGKEKADQMPPVDLKAALRSGAISITDAQNFKKAAAGSGHPDEILSALRTQHPDSANRITALFNGDKDYLTGYTQNRAHQQQLANDTSSLNEDKAATIISDSTATPAQRTQATNFLKVKAQQKAVQKQNDAAADQAAKQGDPKDAGKLMYDGTLTLSELKARSVTPKFIEDATNAALALARANGETNWTPQVGEAQFNAAKSPSNVQFFGSANSLLDQNGTLDQLAAQHAKLQNGSIPVFNKWTDYAKFQAGDPALAGFMQTAVGVADDYAKVMGGGTGSDASRLQVMQSFANSHNPQQMQAAINAARNAVTSQVSARIGKNRVMRQMYGQNLPNTTPSQTQPAPEGTIINVNGQQMIKRNGQWTKGN